jgi:hypothetical protein
MWTVGTKANDHFSMVVHATEKLDIMNVSSGSLDMGNVNCRHESERSFLNGCTRNRETRYECIFMFTRNIDYCLILLSTETVIVSNYYNINKNEWNKSPSHQEALIINAGPVRGQEQIFDGFKTIIRISTGSTDRSWLIDMIESIMYMIYLSVIYVICSENMRTTIIYIQLGLFRLRMKLSDNVNHVLTFNTQTQYWPVFLLTSYVKFWCFCSFNMTIDLIREHITYYVPNISHSPMRLNRHQSFNTFYSINGGGGELSGQKYCRANWTQEALFVFIVK